jgi:mono/diheme cytochrome c family protein
MYYGEVRKLLVVPTLFIVMTAGASAADVKAGQTAYEKACKSCHGADGTPNPGMVKALKVDMRDLKSPEVQAASDDQLKKVITAGTGKMKPVASVTGDSVNDVVAYVRSLKK